MTLSELIRELEFLQREGRSPNEDVVLWQDGIWIGLKKVALDPFNRVAINPPEET